MEKATEAQPKEALKFDRHFTKKGVHPFDDVEWELRSAEIKDWKTGKVSFKQETIEFPASWSQRATDIVTSKYFRGQLGTPSREYSVKQMMGRIVETLSGWGEKQN